MTTNTAVGATAKIDNKGAIGGNALAQGQGSTTAIVLNGPVSYSPDGKSFVDGVIIGNATAIGSLNHNSTVTLDDNDVGAIAPALRTQVTTTVQKYNDGKAILTNDGVIFGNAEVRGSKGTVTNNGVVVGAIVVGEKTTAGTTVVTKTDATTVRSFAAQAVLPVQDYLVDQNGTAGEVLVGDTFADGVNDANSATINSPAFGSSVQVKTADIKATINLNNGSYTAYGVDAQRSSAGAHLTTTTVNLNGSGFVGSDDGYLFGQTPVFPNIVDHNPALFLNRAATTAGFSGFSSARIRGVTELNKTGAGTFVIVGGDYIAPPVPAAQPTWTIDAVNTNIKAGELQLSLYSDEYNEESIRFDPNFVRPEFGIKGNVTNDATLVIGRREPIGPQAVGTKLVNSGTEIIEGTFVRQTGNFTQSKTGNTVVGVTPSLVRFGTVGVNTGSSTNEPLGIIGSGVGVPYFTTPANAAFFGSGNETSIPSRWNVTGDLNLAGTVTAVVGNDSIYVNGAGYTLFNYTGTGTVTATGASSIASQFVKFGVVHSAANKTVRIEATRASYATGATNTNAKNAAVGLDSLIPVVVNAITTDANAGAGFTSVSAIGRAQDAANVISALDWRLTAAQASSGVRRTVIGGDLLLAGGGRSERCVRPVARYPHGAPLGRHVASGSPARQRRRGRRTALAQPGGCLRQVRFEPAGFLRSVGDQVEHLRHLDGSRPCLQRYRRVRLRCGLRRA